MAYAVHVLSGSSGISVQCLSYIFNFNKVYAGVSMIIICKFLSFKVHMSKILTKVTFFGEIIAVSSGFTFYLDTEQMLILQ